MQIHFINPFSARFSAVILKKVTIFWLALLDSVSNLKKECWSIAPLVLDIRRLFSLLENTNVEVAEAPSSSVDTGSNKILSLYMQQEIATTK